MNDYEMEESTLEGDWIISGRRSLTEAKIAALKVWGNSVRFDGSCYVINGNRKWTYRKVWDGLSSTHYKFWQEEIA